MKKRIVNILTGGGGRLLTGKTNATVSPQASVWMALSAFTMAEILLSLTIIGVVAAITLPSLTGNINERTWNTQRKALYSRISQAISLMPSLNGYGTINDTTDTATETFITSGLAKVLKINNICDSEHLADCGVPDKYINHSGAVITPFPNTLTSWFALFNGSYSYVGNEGSTHVTSYSLIDTKVAAFETANGETLVAYYNPVCKGNMNETSWRAQEKMCVNFVYDLNGKKGPNTVGKDIGFMTVFYPTDSIVVSVRPLKGGSAGSTPSDAVKFCKKIDDEGVMPNIYELASISLNRINVRSLPLSGCSSYVSGDRTYINGSLYLKSIGECSGGVGAHNADTQNGIYTYCVKR